MGFHLTEKEMNQWIAKYAKEYRIFAPKCFVGGGNYSDTDCIRYGEINAIEEVVFDKKSQYSFKEVLTPSSQTLFFYTENETKEADMPSKGAMVFLRSCDMHALKRLDEMYLTNGPVDYYYAKLRENMKLVLMGCSESYESCFCVSMGSNQSKDYDMSIDLKDGVYHVDCKDELMEQSIELMGGEMANVTPDYVKSNSVKVQIPEDLDRRVADSGMWKEYDTRCIGCGRCNFVCPTCTCFTMQDISYSDNGKVGERRKVMASCMVDGFTDVAGGGSYRKAMGERMRFKVLHKVLDYKQRNGHHMCIGCGRCDDICPEYISFSHAVNKLEDGMKEVKADV